MMRLRHSIRFCLALAALFVVVDGAWDASSAQAQGNPHGGAMGQSRRKDISQPSAEVPVGTVQAQILTSQGKPKAGTQVTLRILRSSIEQGDKRDERVAVTNDSGLVNFGDLSIQTDFSYTLLVSEGPANFSAGPFRLLNNQGHQVVLHTYPVTRDPNDAMIAAEGVIALRPQDDVFVIDMLYRVFNVSQMAWVPEDFYLDLPEGWKAFTAQDSGDTRFEDGGDRGATLHGTFAPGAHEIGFRFHLTNPQTDSFQTTLPLFPRTVDIRVIADRSPNMKLTVPGLPAAKEDQTRAGQPVLVARKSFLKSKSGSPSTLSIELSGLPTRGPGRFYAAGIALLIAAFGFSASLQRRREPRRVDEGDRNAARQLLLDELVALEKARDKELIGPRNYAQARTTLLEHLARLQLIAKSGPASSSAGGSKA